MLKWFVYFLILFEALAQNQAKKRVLQWKCKTKEAAELIPKKKDWTVKILDINTTYNKSLI